MWMADETTIYCFIYLALTMAIINSAVQIVTAIMRARQPKPVCANVNDVARAILDAPAVTPNRYDEDIYAKYRGDSPDPYGPAVGSAEFRNRDYAQSIPTIEEGHT